MDIRVGIVGDGQLGWMLCRAARALGIHTVILSSDPGCAAARAADECVIGGMDEPTTVRSLVERCDVVTYEREDVAPSAIAVLRAAEAVGEIRCLPSLDIIETIQDKARQKAWLQAEQLPTLDFCLAHGTVESARYAGETLGYPLVQKSLRGGFDGRGVQILRNAGELERAWPGDTLFEAHAGRFTELGVIVVRSQDGETRCFPPVDMRFDGEHAVLEWVRVPSALPPELIERAELIAAEAIMRLGGVGAFGVELFHTEDGQLYINEISPRVHNAGHYTLEATASSQFEQHLRAVAGLPLADMTLVRPAAMRNLLARPPLEASAERHAREAGRFQAEAAGADTLATYWYGKPPARAMRKLGHITATAATAEAAERAVQSHYDALCDGSARETPSDSGTDAQAVAGAAAHTGGVS